MKNLEQEKQNIIEEYTKKVEEEKEKGEKELQEHDMFRKKTEEEAKKNSEEKERLQKEIEEKEKIIYENEEKKKEKISLIFEVDKFLANKQEKTTQFVIEEKRNKKFIQIVNSLFNHYPLLKHIKIKSFENKSDSSQINYYSTPNDNNLNDNSIVSIKLD